MNIFEINSLFLKQLAALNVIIAQIQAPVFNVWGFKTKTIQDY
jgi:hypothetical protein